MKAIVLNEIGNLGSLIEAEIPEPELMANEILVENKAVAVDPVDMKIAYGLRGARAPMILGSTSCGVVKKIGARVTDFKVGDRVVANYRGGQSYAEVVAVPTSFVAHVPDAVSFEDAVSVALSGQTGLQAMHRGLNVRPGEKVLILGASGAVGFIAMQEALRLGAKVSVTASVWGIELINQKFPSVQALDYHSDWTSQVEEMDAVFDTVGFDSVVKQGLSVLKNDGQMISIAGGPVADRRYSHFVNNPEGKNIQVLVDGLADGTYQTIIDDVLPMTPENIATDFLKIQNGGLKGKLILSVV